MKLTCKVEGIGALSFSQVKWTGMSPEVTLQLTCARFPSCKLAEKEKGSISGGSGEINKDHSDTIESSKSRYLAVETTKPNFESVRGLFFFKLDI